MIRVIRTNSNNKDFQKLVRELDIDLKIRDGEEHSFYAQFNKTDTIKYAVQRKKNFATKTGQSNTRTLHISLVLSQNNWMHVAQLISIKEN